MSKFNAVAILKTANVPMVVFVVTVASILIAVDKFKPPMIFIGGFLHVWLAYSSCFILISRNF